MSPVPYDPRVASAIRHPKIAATLASSGAHAGAHPGKAAHELLGIVGTDDPRLSDARVPTGHEHEAVDLPVDIVTAVVLGTAIADHETMEPHIPAAHSHGDSELPAGITRDSELSAAVDAHAATAHGTPHAHPYAADDDPRLSDARTPTAHAHADGDLPTGLTRDAELTAALDTHAATPHGGSHPDLATHDGLGLATDVNVSTAISNHEGAANPHPAYETSAEAQAKVDAHAAAGDPHPGYLTPAEGNAAYQPIDSDLTAIAALSTTAYGRALLALADGAALAAAHAHAGGGDDARITTRALTANQADITGVTLVELANLTVAALAAGTYQFVYRVIYQTTATTTGVEFVVDHSGTLTEFVSNAYFGSTGAAAATGIADQQGVGTAAGLMEVKTARLKNTRPGVTIGVDSANANMLMTIEGVFVATASGNLRLLMAAELASLVVRAMRGSSLVLTKVA